MWPRTLRARLVLFFAGLLVLAESTVLVLLDGAASRISRHEVEAGLQAGEAVFQRLLAQNRQQIERAGELLAADFAFREAVGTRDMPTVMSVLVNHGRRIDARAMMLLDLEHRVIADTLHPGAAARPFPFGELFADAGTAPSGRASGIVMLEGGAGPHQVAVLPVMAPDLIGHVVIAFPVDTALAGVLKATTGLDVSFAADGDDKPWRIFASTLPANMATRLGETLQAGGAPACGGTIEFDGAAFLGRCSTLSAASHPQVVAVLHRSLAAAAEPFDKLRSALLAVAGATLLASVAGSVLLARRINVPLQALGALAQRIRGGDYGEPASLKGPEEIAALAGSLNHMREGIAQREAEITRLAYQDTLTALPNRAMFHERVDGALRKAGLLGGSAAVLTMDLDRFRGINDALGHQFGDQVLQVVGRRLQATLRPCDTVARLGGDEFAVLLPDADAAAAVAIARQIGASFEAPINMLGHTIDVGASIGVAVYPQHGSDIGELLRHADLAMYSAKRERLGFALYDPRSEDSRRGHLSLLSELRRAVEQDELSLRFQPKMDLSRGTLASVEVLIRWQHRVRGELSPAEFIPFAEHTGYIRELTRWVIVAATRQAGHWRKHHGLPLRLAINVSARDLLDPELPRIVADALAAHGVPADAICLEVTETALMEDPARAQETVRRLRDLGVKLSIDDYGTGFSSLAYIKRLSVSELKIDRVFIKDLLHDDDDLAIVRSTVELGHNLGLDVVAEGVEDAATAERLRQLGCDLGQGYFFARPMDAGSLVEWIRAQRAGSRTARVRSLVVEAVVG